METSAKTGFNVMKLFCDAAKILYEDSLKKKEVNKVSKNYYVYHFLLYDIDPELLNQVRLSMQNAKEPKKKGCC